MDSRYRLYRDGRAMAEAALVVAKAEQDGFRMFELTSRLKHYNEILTELDRMLGPVGQADGEG